MPGVIGASIFSPRPGRGYRFHSLHFEIIDYPCNQKFLQLIEPGQAAPRLTRILFVLKSEYLTQPTPPHQHEPNDIASNKAGHRSCNSSTANCGEVLQIGRAAPLRAARA